MAREISDFETREVEHIDLAVDSQVREQAARGNDDGELLLEVWYQGYGEGTDQLQSGLWVVGGCGGS